MIVLSLEAVEDILNQKLVFEIFIINTCLKQVLNLHVKVRRFLHGLDWCGGCSLFGLCVVVVPSGIRTAKYEIWEENTAL